MTVTNFLKSLLAHEVMVRISDYGKTYTYSFEERMLFEKQCMYFITDLLEAGYDDKQINTVLEEDYALLSRWLTKIRFPTTIAVIQRPKAFFVWKTEHQPKLLSHLENVAAMSTYQLELIRDVAARADLASASEGSNALLTWGTSGSTSEA